MSELRNLTTFLYNKFYLPIDLLMQLRLRRDDLRELLCRYNDIRERIHPFTLAYHDICKHPSKLSQRARNRLYFGYLWVF